MKPRIKEVIVVEGRYDRNALAQVVDATVVETGGFSVFNNREKLAFLRRLAEKRGLILLTDPDGAGFVIRNYLKGAIPRQRVKQAYIPDVAGKERRKRRPGRIIRPGRQPSRLGAADAALAGHEPRHDHGRPCGALRRQPRLRFLRQPFRK